MFQVVFASMAFFSVFLMKEVGSRVRLFREYLLLKRLIMSSRGPLHSVAKSQEPISAAL